MEVVETSENRTSEDVTLDVLAETRAVSAALVIRSQERGELTSASCDAHAMVEVADRTFSPRFKEVAPPLLSSVPADHTWEDFIADVAHTISEALSAAS